MKHPAHVAAIGDVASRDVIQFVGLPDRRKREPMQAATHLVIVPDDDGCMLIRFSDDAFAGDTWHENDEHAKSQATSEYGLDPKHWVAVAEGDVPAEWSGQAIRAILKELPDVG